MKKNTDKVNTEPGSEARHALECANAIVDLLPKSKKLEALGEMNDLFLFLEKCIREAKTGK
jgi:hypothetical protein